MSETFGRTVRNTFETYTHTHTHSHLENTHRYFHHEFVMKLMRTGMDGKEGGRRSKRVVRLMKWLRDQEVVSEKQFEIGFNRLKQRLESDVVLDVGPVARIMMKTFESEFYSKKDDSGVSVVKLAARASGARRGLTSS